MDFFYHEHGSQDGIHPYIIGDKVYFLLPYFVIPHKLNMNIKHTFLENCIIDIFQRGGEECGGKCFWDIKKNFSKMQITVAHFCDESVFFPWYPLFKCMWWLIYP